MLSGSTSDNELSMLESPEYEESLSPIQTEWPNHDAFPTCIHEGYAGCHYPGKCTVCSDPFPRLDLTYSRSLLQWECIESHFCLRDRPVSGLEEKVEEKVEVLEEEHLLDDDSLNDRAETIDIMGPDRVREAWEFQQLLCNCMDFETVVSCPSCDRKLPVYDLTDDAGIKVDCLCNHGCIHFYAS